MQPTRKQLKCSSTRSEYFKSHNQESATLLNNRSYHISAHKTTHGHVSERARLLMNARLSSQLLMMDHFCVCCRISYLDIFKVVELTCDKHRAEMVASPSLEEIVHYDLWAREYAAGVQRSAGLSPALV